MTEKAVILVVEDEALIRMGAVQLLEDAGFVAVEAANADDAISILELRNDIRAVFTDVNMPGTLDGIRLARLVRGRWPPIHLILTSGIMAPDEGSFPANRRFIRKPYDPKHVIATIRELLGQAPPSDPLEHSRKAA
jgi:two-component system, response regulator PdtaR